MAVPFSLCMGKGNQGNALLAQPPSSATNLPRGKTPGTDEIWWAAASNKAKRLQRRQGRGPVAASPWPCRVLLY